MTPLLLAALLQASLPLTAVEVKDGQTIQINLEPLGVNVQRLGKGSGAVTSQPAGIVCGSDCAEVYDLGTLVTLTATTAKGSEFAGWGGACVGKEACVVSVDQAELVTAEFVPVQSLKLGMSIGAQVLFATEADTAYNPLVRIDTSVPLSKSLKAPNLLVGVELGGAPGAAVGLEDIQSWTTIEVTIGAALYPLDYLNIGLWGEFGFSSHLPGETEPRVSAPRWGCGGVILDRFEGGSLKGGLCWDERLDGLYRPTVKIKGMVALYRAGEKSLFPEGSMVCLVGEAILGLSLSDYSLDVTGGVKDVIKAGLVIGWGTR